MNPPGRGDRLEDRPDAELVERARTGERDALETLLRRHHERIHLLCHRLCRERGDAEDATQNALLAIVRGLVGFDGTAAFSTWSHRVATNACLDELRRRGRRPVPHATAGADGADRPASAVDGRRWTTDRTDSGRSDGLDADPADLAVVAEQRTALQRALADLPDEFRIPVVLRDVGELDYAEIAELLDLAPGTVRSRISRGRRKLAEALRAEDRRADAAHSADTAQSVDTAQPVGDAPGNPTATSDVREVES
ncbi:MAG: sigma-70 family RNA polymerase sigma factor [Actinomycetota bacterium]|nr:sigma-70 family RNA polymerase sigma factor [Actinomycetota bacterium]